MANVMALALARYKQNKKVLSEGLFGANRMVMFTSEEVHNVAWTFFIIR